MRKLLSGLVLLSVLSIMVFPSFTALAQPVEGCTLNRDQTDIDSACTAGAISETDTQAWGLCCALDAVFTVTDWIFFVLVSIVVLLVLIGGFTIATAGGNPENVNKGRNYIMFAMLGLAIALFARAIPGIVRALLL
ncbi:MAG: hypothetical protein KJI71_04300 [Patescibacteria group bacterium]|nr:hypothetical protein [Patescibacteria group bacterium]